MSDLPPPTPADPPDPDAVPAEPIPPGAWKVTAAIVSTVAWVVAGASTVVQKRRADDLMSNSLLRDFSAVQIQELNGQVTAHALVAFVVAVGVTVAALTLAWALTD